MRGCKVKKRLNLKQDELNVIDYIVEKEKGKARIVKPGRQFLRYIKKVTKNSF